MKFYEIKEKNPEFSGEMSPGVPVRCAGVYYEPAVPTDRDHIALIYNQAPNGVAESLARRGFRAMELRPSRAPGMNMDAGYVAMDAAVRYMKAIDGVKVVLGISWSGGNNELTTYQAVAENGCAILQGDNLFAKISDLPPLTPFDGLINLDPNWGVMRFLSFDPAIRTEGNAMDIDPELDMWNPANGFRVGRCEYSQEFIRRFQRGQAVRMNRLIKYCQERVAAIDRGEGLYEDDEPLVIVSGQEQRDNNLMYPQFPELLSRTKKEWPLVHPDGSITTEIVHTVRKPMYFTRYTDSFADGCLVSTVKSFLRSAIRVSEDFGYDDCHMWGIDWDSTIGTFMNVRFIHVPVLTLGMTASWEFALHEEIYDRYASKDKTLMFIEGAGHNYRTETSCEDYPGQYGDTYNITFDIVTGWIGDGSRFFGKLEAAG